MADIAEAAEWYEQRQQGLGERFTLEISNAIDVLATDPLIYRVRHKRLQARWCYPQHFPYRIVYCVSGEVVTVLAVIHAARRRRQ
jgi:toxin ParE1/3/4